MPKKKENTIRARALRDGTVVQVLPDGSTKPFPPHSWEAFDALTEEEINERAMSDPDCLPSTDEQLARMKRVPNVKEIRRKLKLTQKQFAYDFHLHVKTVRDWEQHRSMPDAAAMTLLRVIEKDPEAVRKALE